MRIIKGNVSIKKNMLLNSIKGIMGIIFPLITFPYVSRILGVEQLGQYNFATSIIIYIMLIAGLGINTYAIREGAKIRENKQDFNQFASEMFSINTFTTVISYFILAILLIFVPKFHAYTSILIVLSLQVIFKTIGVEWLYSIYEEFTYITIRSITFQFISLGLMFLFVKTKEDLLKYALVTVVSSSCSNVFNYFHSKHYCHIKLTLRMGLDKHIKDILILFATILTVTIYVSSDITMIGFLLGDYEVGIYSVSVKVYTIVKTILASALIVSIPRLSFYLGKNENEKFRNVATDIHATLLTLLLPAAIGIILLRKEIVWLIAGNDYIQANVSLAILAIAMIFSMEAYFWGQCILIPLKKENIVLFVTIFSALVNVVLNFLLIPIWKENAAAFTTVISELIVFIYCMIYGKKYINLNGMLKEYAKIVFGCVLLATVIYVVRLLDFNTITSMFLSIISSCAVYFISQILLKNTALDSISALIERKLKHN